MRISELLRRKGDDVVTVAPRASVAELVELLGTHGIGAAVVVGPGDAVVGVVSERDVVRALHQRPSLTGLVVADLMSSHVFACAPEDETEALARTMTEHRVRHMPVLVDGRLVGIVSIGDIVKQRLDELQAERDHLVDYVLG